MLGRLKRYTISPAQFQRVSYVALGALTVIVLTGAAVRLTDSGLGCPDWPRCYGHALPPLSSHALIEFGNRLLSGVVGIVTGVVAVLAFRRRPFRRDLAVLAVLLPLGVVAQAAAAPQGVVVQVAARMYISTHTVAHHLRQAFRKLSIASRVDLTRIVIEQATVPAAVDRGRASQRDGS